MKQSRRKHSPSFKAKVVIEALKGEEIISEPAGFVLGKMLGLMALLVSSAVTMTRRSKVMKASLWTRLISYRFRWSRPSLVTFSFLDDSGGLTTKLHIYGRGGRI